MIRRFTLFGLLCLALAGIAFAGFSTAAPAAGKPLATAVHPSAKQTTTNVTVHATEFNFTLSQNTVPVGTVVFTVINDGQVTHDFAIAGKDTPTLNPGQTATLTVDLTQPGQYQYLCTIGEHAVYGMSGFVTATGTGGVTTTPTPKPSRTITAVEKEFKITLSSKGKGVKTIKPGTVKFVVINNGKLPHNFVIAGKQSILLKSHQKTSLVVTLKKGSYKYLCSITGHAAAGMKGVLKVK